MAWLVLDLGSLSSRCYEMKTPVAFLAILAIAACSVRLYLTQFHRPSAKLLKPDQALGECAADETAKLLDNHGNIVIVRETRRGGISSLVDIQVDSFNARLKNLHTIKVAAIELVEMSRLPVSPEIRMSNPLAEPSIGLSAAGVLKVLRSHPDAKAYVLFGALPSMNSEEMNALKEKASQWVVLSDYEPHYKILLKSGVIGLVIAPRSGPVGNHAKEPKTTREWFEQEYEVITPDSR